MREAEIGIREKNILHFSMNYRHYPGARAWRLRTSCGPYKCDSLAGPKFYPPSVELEHECAYFVICGILEFV